MLRFLLVAAIVLGVAACSSMEDPAVTLTVQQETVEATGDTFTYVALAADLDTLGGGRVVAVPVTIPASAADTSITWDLAFRGTEVLLNSGPSGPGAAVGTFVDVPFEEVERVDPSDLTFRRDGESACPGGSARAVCAEPGSPFSPYLPDGNGGITTDESRTLILRIGDARGYAKVRFVSYDSVDPAAPESGGTVTIEFLVNPYGRLLTEGVQVSP